MTANDPSTVVFVGAGNISGPYADSVMRHPQLRLIGVHDVDGDRAAAFAAERSCTAFDSLQQVADARPDVVVNLTSAPHHFATTRALLRLGLDVFSEKPLALAAAEAVELRELAASSSAEVACAPSLWLGRAYQEAARRVRAGALGAVRLVTAEVHQGRIEQWHPAPQSFFRVGPVVDTGIYPLAYVSAVLGPVVEVSAVASTALPDRRDRDGNAIDASTSDTWLVAARFADGALLRLTADFFVSADTLPRRVQFHGVRGSLRLEDCFVPDAGIATAAYDEPFGAVEPQPPEELDWSLGVLDLAAARREGRRPRLSIEHAAHVVDVLVAIGRSAEEGRAVEIASTFPDPFEHLRTTDRSVDDGSTVDDRR